MKKNKVVILTEQVENDFLPFVQQPGRYIGGEINQIRKDLSQSELTIALCFPDIYEVGMSNTGISIIYDCLNTIDGVAAERVFSPWIDAEKVLREKNIPLFSLESKASMQSFDIVGFSLTNELCYTNVLNMLDLGGMKVRSIERSEDDPLIIGGGGMANCCEPIADFFDMFVLGEGEEAVIELANLVRDRKKIDTSKKEILSEIADKFDWAYVPSLEKQTRRQNAIVQDFDNAHVPLAPIVPFVQAVHERVNVEIMRGCPGRCRFCQASFCRRPIRYRSIDRVIDIAKKCYHSTGYDTVSLLSLSSAEYPELEKLASGLHEYFKDKHVGISLPSLRVDKQLKLLPELVSSVRKAGLTIAVEAASEKLRRIVNKPLKDEDLFAAAEAAYRAGWQKFKLYFMVGLPGETLDDVKRIVQLSYDLAKLRKKVDNKTGSINVAVSWFVPKAHTPFGWLGQKPREYFEDARKIILDEKRDLRAKFLSFKFHHIDASILESAIGRGDRRLGDVTEAAWRAGAKFDLWDECFNVEIWQKAFEQSDLNLDSLAQREFSVEETLPWEHLGGPDKNYLLKHLADANQIVNGE
ncbi:MAG: TIGR03960 family B12-binding radical SAM protein [Sedimentisphaerales bacterium]|nr:TIGR03960 family B12-binding radical SAM protein [Sedimentisphaerales bacterium]